MKLNAAETVFIVSNTNLEANEIAKMLRSTPDVNVFVTDQKRFDKATWQNVEGEIRFNVNSFMNKYCEYQREAILLVSDNVVIETKTGTLKEALADYGMNIKSVAKIVGINLEGNTLYEGNHIKTTPEKSALEQVAESLDIDLTFDQVLVAAYARGGISEVVNIGHELQMRPDELIQKVVDIRMRDSKEKDEFYDYNLHKTLSAKDICERVEHILESNSTRIDGSVLTIKSDEITSVNEIIKDLLQADVMMIKRPSSLDVWLHASKDICDNVEMRYSNLIRYEDPTVMFIPKNIDEVHLIDVINDIVKEQSIETNIDDIENETDIEQE